jgi:hypothetical protein
MEWIRFHFKKPNLLCKRQSLDLKEQKVQTKMGKGLFNLEIDIWILN